MCYLDSPEAGGQSYHKTTKTPKLWRLKDLASENKKQTMAIIKQKTSNYIPELLLLQLLHWIYRFNVQTKIDVLKHLFQTSDRQHFTSASSTCHEVRFIHDEILPIPIARACPQWVGKFNHPSAILTVGMFKVWKQCDSVVSKSLSMDNNELLKLWYISQGCLGAVAYFWAMCPKNGAPVNPSNFLKVVSFGIIGHWISWVGLSAFKKLVMQLPFLCELFLFNVYCQLSNDEKWPWTIPTALIYTVHIILESLQHRMGWIVCLPQLPLATFFPFNFV